VLAFALWLAAMLGPMHSTLHQPGASHATLAAALAAGTHPAADDAGAAPHKHGLLALFGIHTDAECRLYDHLGNGPLALGVPPVVLPVMLPTATFAWLEGEALARWAAVFDARGPPAAR